MTRAHLLAAVLLAALGACSTPRPTEFVNVTFAASVPTDHFRTWDLELASCRGFDDPRVDDDRVHELLVDALREELEGRGYPYRPGGEVDFRVYYELWIADSGDPDAVTERGRGRVFVRDVASGRLVWRGERKAPVSREADATRTEAAVRAFVAELLQYAPQLAGPDAEPRR